MTELGTFHLLKYVNDEIDSFARESIPSSVSEKMAFISKLTQ